MFTYCYGRALAEKRGLTFSCPPWIGDKIFDLNEPPSSLRCGADDADAIVITDYCQNQDSLIYTRKQVRDWFRFKPEIQAKLDTIPTTAEIVAHRRVGDYPDLGYVVVSYGSYISAMVEFGYGNVKDRELTFVTEEEPLRHPDFTGDLAFLPDFYQLMKAKVLFRGNSSFSWWAATLSDAEVYAPVVAGLVGGKEQDCQFVKGNWPRFCDLPFITDLHLTDEA